MPWAPGRRSSRLRTGMPPNSWPMGAGSLVPFEDPAAIADMAIELLDNEAARQAMRKRAYTYGRHMVWGRVAQSYMHTFVRASAGRKQPARAAFPVQTAQKNATSRLINA